MHLVLLESISVSKEDTRLLDYINDQCSRSCGLLPADLCMWTPAC